MRTLQYLSRIQSCALFPLRPWEDEDRGRFTTGLHPEDQLHLGVDHATVLTKLREHGIPTRDVHGRPRPMSAARLMGA
jgi:hypothetical protein